MPRFAVYLEKSLKHHDDNNAHRLACESTEDLRKALEERFDEDETRMETHQRKYDYDMDV